MNILVTEALKKETEEELSKMSGCHFIFTKDVSTLNDDERNSIELFLGGPKKEELEQLPNVKIVQLFSAGANKYTWIDDSIILANAYGAYGQGIAEHMLAVTLCFQKDFFYYLNKQRNHEWSRTGKVFMAHSAKVLSVGMGSIGTEYLRLMSLLGADCYGVRRTVHDKPSFVKEVYTMDALDKILPEFDVIALSLPETDETKYLFNGERLRKMKKNAILMNVGRGSAIVTADLIQVLKEGYFQGVSLDVTDPEPLTKNNVLWNFDNVQITPHISGGFTSIANYDNVMNVVKENIQRYLDGKEPLHIVNKKLGY